MDEPFMMKAYREARSTRASARKVYDPDTRRKRNAEANRRASLARARVLIALRHLHPDEYATLYGIAMDEILGERGPLPGDE